MTAFDTYTDPYTTALTSVNPQGLIPYLDAQIGFTFANLEVRNYGFTGNAIDLNRLGSGFRLPTPKTEGMNQHQELCTEQIVIAKIMPIAIQVQGVADTTNLKLWYYVQKEIRRWVNCKSAGFGVTNNNKFEVTGIRDRVAVSNLPPSDPRSRWHVLSWKFELSLYR